MTYYNSGQNQTFLPARIKYNSLGISVSDTTLNNLNLSSTQYLIVGEHTVAANTNLSTYSLYSDIYGVAINLNSLNSNLNLRQQYSLYVSGNMYIDGTITTPNGVLSGSNGGGMSGSNGDIFWNSTSDYSGIYYAGNVIIGTKTNASVANSNSLSIIDFANRDINHAQIGIQNLETSQFRMGILGAAADSPTVFATSSNAPIEFHVGRDQSYFNSVYTNQYYLDGVLKSATVDNPVYGDQASNAPHLLIDPNGNVGIHTSGVIPQITYPYRYVNTISPSTGITTTVVTNGVKTDTPIFYAEGTLYASDIVVRNVDTNTYASLDSLYVRQLGITLLANQIVPGEFAQGYYQFKSNVSIMGSIEDAYQLKIYGSERITNTLQVDSLITTSSVKTDTLLTTGAVGFCNDIYANQNLTVKDSLFLKGGIWTEALDTNGSNLGWCQVQFMVASPVLSNINYIGQGITTPGRFGAGIDPTNPLDAVNNQVVIVKNNPDIFGLEVKDRSVIGLIRTILIGQPNNQNLPYDGSTVFATPQALDTNYNTSYLVAPGIPQNIYFYPGADISPSAGLILTSDNPPVLGVFANSKYVGVGTYSPNSALHVEGQIYASSNIRIFDPVSQTVVSLGIWKQQSQPNNINGISYYNPQSAHVGINTAINSNYGLVLSGGFKSTDGIYGANDALTSYWYNTTPPIFTSNVYPNPNAMYTQGFVGIGNTLPYRTLDVVSATDTSAIRIRGSSYSDTSVLEFQTVKNLWTLGASSYFGSVAIYDQNLMTSNFNLSATALWCGINNTTGLYQVSIGCSASNRAQMPATGAALLVNGGISVIGDVNITGAYRVNGNQTYDSQVSNPLPALNTNDVFIGGGDIYFNPSTTTSAYPIVAVGYTAKLRTAQISAADTSLFRVYNPGQNVIASFYTNNTTGLIQIVNIDPDKYTNPETYQSGVQIGFINNTNLVIQDLTGAAYLSFLPKTNFENYVGINTSTPTAVCHVYTAASGQNLFKLTKAATADTSSVAPEINLEKTISVGGSVTNTFSWVIHGPEYGDGSINDSQRLAFLFSDSTKSVYRNELFCMTPNGCIGIGTTRPQYALDINGTGSQSTLRVFSSNVNNLLNPQLILQSGITESNNTVLTTADYRFYALNSNLLIQSTSVDSSINTVLFVDEHNNVGVGTSSIGNYQLTVGGDIDIKGGIYINEIELFNAASGGQTTLSGNHIILNPSKNGSVQINSPIGLFTSNLFTIYSGTNPNMALLDSSFNECQLNFRNIAATIPNIIQPVYRLCSSNTAFDLKYNPNVNTITVSSSNDGYGLAWSTTPQVSGLSDFLLTVNTAMTLSGTMTSPTPTLSFASYSNILNIVPASTLADTTGSLYIRSSNVGIGTPTPNALLEVSSAATNNTNTSQDLLRLSSYNAVFVKVGSSGDTIFSSNVAINQNLTVSANSLMTGDVNMSSNLVVQKDATVKGYFTNTSDRRVKDDLQPISGALEKVCALKGYSYVDADAVADIENQTAIIRKIGLIAQEVQEIFPEAVREDDKGMLSIAYGNLVAVLVEAIKELAHLHKNN